MNAPRHRGKDKKFENIWMYNENKTKNNRKQILVCTAIQQWDETIATTTETKFLLLILQFVFLHISFQ